MEHSQGSAHLLALRPGTTFLQTTVVATAVVAAVGTEEVVVLVDTTETVEAEVEGSIVSLHLRLLQTLLLITSLGDERGSGTTDEAESAVLPKRGAEPTSRRGADGTPPVPSPSSPASPLSFLGASLPRPWRLS